MQTILNSAPRVGSTWMIAMLEKLLNSKYQPIWTRFVNDVEVLMKNPEKDKLLKMHNGNPIEVHALGLKQIILIRNIYDMIVSRIHFERRMWTLQEDEEMPDHQRKMKDFIQANPHLKPQEFVDKFFELGKINIEIWIRNAYPFVVFEHPEIFKCSYEEMIEDCFSVMKRICVFLNLDKCDEEIRKIVNEHKFEVMAKKKIGEDNWMDHQRKGIIGDYKNYLKPEHIEFIDKTITYVKNGFSNLDLRPFCGW